MNTSQLYRSRENRVIAGIAGGLAEQFNIDVSLIRLIWIFTVVFWGGGFLAYLIASVIIPERSNPVNLSNSNDTSAAAPPDHREKNETENSTAIPAAKSEPKGSHSMVGVILIGLGLFLLFKSLLPWHWSQYIWPVFIIIFGVWLLVKPKKA